MDKEKLKRYRYFLKDSIRKKIVFRFTDQNQGLPPPPIEKSCRNDANRIDLPGPETWKDIPPADLTKAIGNRKSHRVYLKKKPFVGGVGVSVVVHPGIAGKSRPWSCVSECSVCRVPPCH